MQFHRCKDQFLEAKTVLCHPENASQQMSRVLSSLWGGEDVHGVFVMYEFMKILFSYLQLNMWTGSWIKKK